MKLRSLLFPPPAKARHYKRTLLFSPDDESGRPSDEVIELALKAADRARTIRLPDVSARMDTAHRWPDFWPGEHYRLLAAFVDILKPARVVEIGTFTGLSALSMKSTLPAGASFVTYDVLPWNSIPGTCLKAEDFEKGRFEQVLGDLGRPDVMAAQKERLRDADFFFVDGPKDKVFEPAFWRNLQKIGLTRRPWFVFDDIKDWNMLGFWRELDRPKLDMTSFGHWTGTGLVRW